MTDNNLTEQLKKACNPNTSESVLIELAKREDKEILALIAKNPNSPPNLLVELAEGYLEEIGENPALERILTENYSFIKNIYYKHFSCYLPQKNINPPTDWFLKAGAIHPESRIREFVATSDRTSNLLLEQLATDSVAEVRVAVANNFNASDQVLLKLSEDPNNDVRTAVAYNKKTRLLYKDFQDHSDDIVEKWIIEIEEKLNSCSEITFQTTAINVTSDSVDNLIFSLKDKGYQVENLTRPYGINAFRISR